MKKLIYLSLFLFPFSESVASSLFYSNGYDAYGVDLMTGETIWSTSLNINALAVTSAVPVPSAVWLFGSGLIGLIGLARRKS